MVDRFIAFRFFGTFLWPPRKKLEAPLPPETGETEGIVEIHYVRDPSKNHYVACLRWRPRPEDETELWKPFVTPLAGIPNIHEAAYDKPEDALKADVEAAYRIDARPDKSDGGERLRLEGARVFDQFRPFASASDGEAAPRPSLRLPLVRRQFQTAKVTVLSSIQIGGTKEEKPKKYTTLRLDLGMPTASPVDDEQSIDGKAFCAFSVQYEARFQPNEIDAADAGLRFNTPQFGRRKKQEDIALPSTPIIGEFDFARPSAGDWDKHWPTARSILRTTLPGLGYRVAKKGSQNPETGFKASPRRAIAGVAAIFPSVRFRADPEPGGDAPRFEIVQRLVLECHAAVNGIDEARSDIRARSKNIQLRAPGRPDGWLKTASKLFIAIELRGAIANAEVWSDTAGRDLTGKAAIGWDTALSEGFETLAGDDNKGKPSRPPRIGAGASPAELLAGAVGAMSLAQTDLFHLMPTQPQSALPNLTLAESPNREKHFAGIATLEAHLRNDQAAVITARSGAFLSPARYWVTLPTARHFGVLGTLNAAERKRYFEIAFEATWPSFHLPGASRTLPKVKLVFTCFEDSPGSERFLAFSIKEGDAAPQRFDARLGGFLFGRNGELQLVKDGQAQLRIGARPPGPPTANAWAVADLELILPLAFDAVEPVAVDVPWGDRTALSQPLLLDETEAGGAASDAFQLLLTESLGERDDRWLRAELIERSQSQRKATNSILLSREPFAFQRFVSEPLDQRGDAGNAAVATYDSDTRVWRIKQVGHLYRYVLPPQSIGESMDKPRRLEIHDAPAGWRRPFPEGSTGLERHAVEFRLTPPADLWIRPSDVERNYFLPEWASREIFRQRGELGLGAALAAFRGEFVYGLAVGLDPEFEKGPSRRARVAEIEALTGHTVGAATRPAASTGERWDRLRSALASRPERLEIWADDPASQIPFAPARFAEGASFALRSTALHRSAVAALEPPVGANWPHPPVALSPEAPRLHPLGLSGGALWPIESGNVLSMVLQAPSPSGGAIEQIALSPLGGDADQSVHFAGNRVSIITETRGGYVQRHKVEVIGRIAVFWNRAKHVVVYERTTSPSAQFAPAEATRTRRPVLRKVQEYVEILQPERRFPDSPTAAAFTCGFLRAQRYNRRIIPVDSAWAEDIGTTGWKVPLWNRHAARVRPQIYERPDVVVVTAAEGPGGTPEGAQEILDPDNLYFFTDTSPGLTDKTDDWEPRPNIDFVDLPPPSHAWPAGTPPKAEHAASDRPTDNAPRVPIGFARFTWRLAPPAHRATINQGRGDKPVFAALDTITFMRAGRAANFDPVHVRVGLLRQVRDLANAKGASEPIFGPWLKGKPLSEDAPALLRSASGTLAAVALPAALPTDASEQERIKLAIGELKGSLDALVTGNGELTDAIKNTFAAYQTSIGEIDKIFAPSGPLKDQPLSFPSCASLTKNLEASVSARRLAILQQIQVWEAGIADGLAGALAGLPDIQDRKDKLKEHLKSTLAEEIGPVFTATEIEVGKAQHGIEIVRSTVVEARAELQARHDEARSDLEALRRSIDESKPWSKARIEAFEARLDDAILRTRHHAEGVIRDARQRLTTATGDAAGRVAAIAARMLADLSSGEASLAAAIGESRDAAKQAISKLYQRVGELIGDAGAIAKLRERLTQLAATAPDPVKEKIEELKEGLTELEAKLESVHEKLDALERDLTLTVETASQSVSGAIKMAASEASTLLQDAANMIGEAIEVVGSGLADLGEDVVAELEAKLDALRKPFDATIRALLADIAASGRWIDRIIDDALWAIERALDGIDAEIGSILAAIEDAAAGLNATLEDIRAMLDPQAFASMVVDALIDAMHLDQAVDQLANELFASEDALKEKLPAAVQALAAVAVAEINAKLGAGISFLLGKVLLHLETACKSIAGGAEAIKARILREAAAWLADFGETAAEYQEAVFDKINGVFDSAQKYADFVKAFDGIDRDVRRVGNDLAQAREQAEAYGHQVIDAVSRIGAGGPLAVPNDILRAMAAAASAPELPNLDYAKDRLAYYYGLVDDAVDTTPVEAWFGRLGDELKAMGLSLPFSRIGDRLEPVDLSGFDIGRIFRNFGGLDLGALLKGYKLPANVRDAIAISHDFDRKSFRAWVRIDVNAALPERRSLFTLGPFTLDVVQAKLTGFVRLEASKDAEKVEQTESATLLADLDCVVAGLSMVTLREVAVRYDRQAGLKVDFDPTKIKLNPNFEFIQQTLASIYGDEIGGLSIVKRDGIPVGVEHLFAMPPLSLMGGTSGVQNIQIANRFQLLAYPDFVIADSFSLARPERPFIFSIFILGGTGWLTIDVEYRPFEDSLLVVVDAGAGGSASLGFAFAGVTGSVYITLSVALTYRKLIGQPGGGLTFSFVLVVAGVVDVLGIVSAFLSVVLRLSYSENGDMEARGSFSLSIRISRFFKISVSGDASYRVSAGRTQSSSSSQTDVAVTGDNLEKAKKLLAGQGG